MNETNNANLENIQDDLIKAKGEYSSVGEKMRKDLFNYNTYAKNIKNDLSRLCDITKAIYLLEHPVGSVVMNTSGHNPELFYGGKWEQYAKGRTIIGVGVSIEEYSKPNITGGSELIKHNHTGFTHNHAPIIHSHKIPIHKHILPKHAHPQSHYHTLNKHTHLTTHNHTWEHQHIQSFSWNGSYYSYLNKPMNDFNSSNTIETDHYELSNKSANKTNKNILQYTSNPYTSLNKESSNVFINNETSGITDIDFTNDNKESSSYTETETKFNTSSNTSEDTITLDHSDDTVDDGYFNTMQPYITCYYFRRIE